MFPRVVPALFALALSVASAAAAAPILKPNDVIAFVGGEDMVAMSEYGYLELLLTGALPAYKLRFRCLAWEGDTVFEQRRDLNYPTIEQQLERIAATVVIAQFGQMESLAGKDKQPEFVTAYEKLIGRLTGAGRRQIFLVAPTPVEALWRANANITSIEIGGIKQPAQSLDHPLNLLRRPSYARDKEARDVANYTSAVGELAQELKLPFGNFERDRLSGELATTRDGFHLSVVGQQLLVNAVSQYVHYTPSTKPLPSVNVPPGWFARRETLRQLITAKNRLWFHYYRPQNWAFLAGDRTNQPSSRDHLDPSKRWFPEELEKFLPLIEAKEREIWELAKKLTADK